MIDSGRLHNAARKKKGETTRLGQEIRLMRLRKGYTREYVAALMDTSPSSLYTWEQQGVCPRPDKYRQLASLLNISLDTLIEYMDEMVPTDLSAFSDDRKEF